MNEMLEILKYTLPALIVFLTAYLLIRMFLKNEERKRLFELSLSQKDKTLPLRLQAYERLILYLERISPDAIIMRMSRSNQSIAQLQNEMITSVRTEFEHNLAQQTYISSQGWEKVKSAKNGIIKLITESAADMNPQSSGIALGKAILENAMELAISPTHEAIESLKKEVRELF
jgi:Mg2+/citrate symporter